ncbi:MAG: CaiB/BaiF CoA-transferase family protein [Burkholderiaceae bacterium]
MNTIRPGAPASGPLEGLRVIELTAIGPVPFAGAWLADMGADVVHVDRPPGTDPTRTTPRFDFYNRNKRSVALDLKQPAAVGRLLALVEKADVLLEGYRPGVAERLGVGPDVCAQRNPKLVYARMTGWGQHGALSQEAGHDINYLALTGALHYIGGPGQAPAPPLNLVADLGGGAMYLVAGVLAALHEVARSGQGQVIDAAMVDGVAHLMSAFQAYRQQGTWTANRGENIVDGGAPYYGTYETQDGKYVAVGAIEPHFYANLLAVLGLDAAALPPQNERSAWPAMRERFAAIFRSRTREQWERAMAGREACFSPVLDIDEAWTHPQMVERGTFTRFDGLRHPSPAPRLSRTPGMLCRPTPTPGQHDDEVRRDWGVAAT